MTHSEIILCPICGITQCTSSPPSWNGQAQRDIYHISCSMCGVFNISLTLRHILSTKYISPRQRTIASSKIYDSRGTQIFICEHNYKDYFERSDISMLEKADKLLIYTGRQSSDEKGFQRNIQIDFVASPLRAECWAMNPEELEAICLLLQEREFLRRNSIKSINEKETFTITAKGWERLEQLRSPNRDSPQGFVAMWFHDSMHTIYEKAFAPAIQSAGYNPHCVDKREHIDKIDDEIILQIRRSRFVVADATGHRGGVYYEAGFAYGLGLPVFWTCRKDAMQDLHFDVNHYNCIVWEADKLDEFRTALAHRIEAILGRGPRPS